MPSELSGGMKKRVALARSIIYDTTNNAIEPEVYLLMNLSIWVMFWLKCVKSKS